LLKQEELENVCLIAEYQRVVLFSSLDVKVAVRLHLQHCRVVEGITCPVIHSSVHGKHNGANF